MPLKHELNLLPSDRRAVLARQAMIAVFVQLVRNFCLGLIVITIVGGLAIAGIEGLIFMADTSAIDRLTQAQEQYNTMRQEIAEQNILIELLHDHEKQRVVWSDIMTNLFQILPGGVTVKSVEGDTRPENRLTFKGTASNRNILIVTNDRLHQQEWVDRVDAPHSNLVSRFNSAYIFTVFLKQQQPEE